MQIIKCVICESTNVVKAGCQPNGKHCFKCQDCDKRFQSDYLYNGAKQEVKLQIVKMLLDGVSTRKIAKVLNVSDNTVSAVKKKLKIFLQSI
jgi:transposase-like protein